MFYDRLAEIAERHFPKWCKVIDDARLFAIEKSSGGHADADITLARWQPEEQVIENYRLPFDTVAIEDPDDQGGCVVFKTVSAEQRHYKFCGVSGGSSTTLLFLEGDMIILPSEINQASVQYGKVCEMREFRVWCLKGKREVEECLFSMSEVTLQNSRRGLLRSLTDDGGINTFAGAVRSTPSGEIYIGGELADRANPKHARTVREARASMAMVAGEIDILSANIAYLRLNSAVIQTLMLCEPSTFVVEQSHVDHKDREQRQGKVTRSPYRKHYIVLTPGEIKKRYLYDESDPTNIPKAPHERRGHYRKLSHERYKAKKDHLIWVKPCWVGKTEGVRGKNKYLVRIDL
jgi:hypothetical protein